MSPQPRRNSRRRAKPPEPVPAEVTAEPGQPEPGSAPLVAIQDLTVPQLAAILENDTDTFEHAGTYEVPAALEALKERADDDDPAAAAALERLLAADPGPTPPPPTDTTHNRPLEGETSNVLLIDTASILGHTHAETDALNGATDDESRAFVRRIRAIANQGGGTTIVAIAIDADHADHVLEALAEIHPSG